MIPIYITKLGFIIQKTDINTQRFDGLALIIYEMVLTSFSVYNKLEKIWFLEETFLFVDTSIRIILKMIFFTFSNLDMQFIEKEFK